MLVEEHHGGVPDGLPVTVGTVCRMWVVTVAFELRDNTWWPGESPATFREVPASPPAFSSGLFEADRAHQAEIGVLVDLAVPDR